MPALASLALFGQIHNTESMVFAKQTGANHIGTVAGNKYKIISP